MSIGGTALFTWFKTPVELLAFVDEISLGFIDAEGEADLRKQIGECRSRLGTLDKPNDQILIETNKILENEYTSIPWWGSFEELCVDHGDFASEMRERFREEEMNEEDNPAPIKPEEQTAFSEFLAEYFNG